METNLACVIIDELNYCNQNVIETLKTFQIQNDSRQKEAKKKKVSMK